MATNKTTVGTDKGKNARKHKDESGMFIIFLFIDFNTPTVFLSFERI
jgi:hypothetical protein